MQALCFCVTGQERIPNPDCEKCGGTGFFEVTFPENAVIAAIWIGRCPVCGASNGCVIQRQGNPVPKPDPYWRCVNDRCACPPVELVNIASVTSWSAVCPFCSSVDFSDFQQRAGDKPPTPETHPRLCPNLECQSPMTWVPDKELEEDLDP